MEKICFVVQRYGLDVNGGAEFECRQLAEHMCQRYQVEVYTTCAVDYTTWKNEYAPGDEVINGVLVHRYPVECVRDVKKFEKDSQRVIGNPYHLYQDELDWLEEQGPVCNQLLDDLEAHYDEYRSVIFMTYLYYLSAMGLLRRHDRSLLIPTFHDEAPAYLYHFQRVFEAAQGFIWNTAVECEFANKRFYGIEQKPGIVGCAGIDIPQVELPSIPEELTPEQYIVYAGRIDSPKGCDRMFEYFLRYREEYGWDIKLALMGKAVIDIPEDESIVNLGFVSEEMKFAVMKNAKALVLFSEFESLSLVVLESMLQNRPVLVNGKCDVLVDHCRRSNAGMYFTNYDEFAGELEYMYNHEDVYRQMCENGSKYVKENYQWDAVVNRIDGLIQEVCNEAD